MGKVDLGEKLSCSDCGARYYDLNKTPALCPKCGAENERQRTFKTKKASPSKSKPAKVDPMPVEKKKEDAENAEDADSGDDDDAGLIDDDDDLDDDSVGSVIGPIESKTETTG